MSKFETGENVLADLGLSEVVEKLPGKILDKDSLGYLIGFDEEIQTKVGMRCSWDRRVLAPGQYQGKAGPCYWIITEDIYKAEDSERG